MPGASPSRNRIVRLAVGRLVARLRDGITRARVLGGELRLFTLLDRRDVVADHAPRIAGRAFAAVEPERFVAEAFDQGERVRDEQHRLAAAAEVAELVEALVGEALVADGQHFIDQQDVRVDVNGDGKARETHVHAESRS